MSGHLVVSELNHSLKPKYSFGKQLEPLSPLHEEVAQDKKKDSSSWLMEAEVCIQRDLETSKKELELIKGVSEEVERRLSSQDLPGGRIRDQKVLMSACQEYSRSRIHLLRQRLRQVLFWSNNRIMGQKIPNHAPAEWATADLEWREWLGEQAAARGGTFDRARKEREDIGSTADALWGPLPHILAAYTWHVEERGV